MAATFTVQADSEREARAELVRLCAALGLEPLGRPLQVPGRARWMARAVRPIAGRARAAGPR